MASIKGSRTERNLLTAFAGESQARNRYTYFADKARDEGFDQVGFIFEETANQEREHAKRFFSFLEGGEAEISAAFPAGVIASTRDNLLEAAAGEHYENSELYPGFAGIAREEGFQAVAVLFENVARAEVFHEKRYRALADNIANDRVFRRGEPVVWRCRNCGFTHENTDAPGKCPACAFPRSFFELLLENW